jgi:hypothetical protein
MGWETGGVVSRGIRNGVGDGWGRLRGHSEWGGRRVGSSRRAVGMGGETTGGVVSGGRDGYAVPSRRSVPRDALCSTVAFARLVVAGFCVGLLVACTSAHEANDAASAVDAGVDGSSAVDAPLALDGGCPDLPELLAFEEARDRTVCLRGVSCLMEPDTSDRYPSMIDEYCRPNVDHSDYLCAQLGSGALVFDRDAARACLDALVARARMPCFEALTFGDDWLRLGFDRESSFFEPPDCARVVGSGVEILANGEPADCTRAPCQQADRPCVAGASCGGTCGRAVENEPCNSLVPCDVGLVCDPSSAICRDQCAYDSMCAIGSYCIDERCVAMDLPSAGEPCLATISSGNLCGDGTFCDPATHTCEPTRAFGEACIPSFPDPCAYGACLDGQCGPAAPCDPSPLPESQRCVPELPWCGTDRLCTADASSVACTDEPRWFGFDSCPPGTLCDVRGGMSTMNETCTVPAPFGAACGPAVQCVPGARCIAERCVRLVAPGEPCGADAACPLYRLCLSGVCEEFGEPDERALGERCAVTSTCHHGACRDGRCAWVPSGEICAASRECRNGDCISNRCAPYVLVADGEPCDGHGRICPEPMRCLPTGEDDDLGVPVEICRAPCGP